MPLPPWRSSPAPALQSASLLQRPGGGGGGLGWRGPPVGHGALRRGGRQRAASAPLPAPLRAAGAGQGPAQVGAAAAAGRWGRRGSQARPPSPPPPPRPGTRAQLPRRALARRLDGKIPGAGPGGVPEPGAASDREPRSLLRGAYSQEDLWPPSDAPGHLGLACRGTEGGGAWMIPGDPRPVSPLVMSAALGAPSQKHLDDRRRVYSPPPPAYSRAAACAGREVRRLAESRGFLPGRPCQGRACKLLISILQVCFLPPQSSQRWF